MNFREFFAAATGHKHGPFDYQCRLACGERKPGETEDRWLEHGSICESRLINIPTGLGKTAAVVLAWLWNRVAVPPLTPPPPALNSAQWPRRLVYCLPMRTLVEQTADETDKWLKNLISNSAALGIIGRPLEDLKWLGDRSPIILMGGEEAEREWDIYPERPAILIGTQDMLLSRALNRGYGMNRYRWPMHFGLLNNDCLWVMDETQLMGVGVETSAQLEGFRHLAEWANTGNCPTWWMSATLDDARLATVDHPKPAAGWKRTLLSDTEREADGIRERFEAKKPVVKSEFVLSSVTEKDHAKKLADFVKQKHVRGTLTLVVVNRVSRARELYTALRDKKLGFGSSRLALIHSRFRLMDRNRHTKLLFGDGDRIVIATQAVEAGVDVSAQVLITELAPWSSMVQRIGRCNRRGDLNDKAQVIWIDIPNDEKDDLALPYSADDLKRAREAISGLSDAGPQSLAGIQVPEAPVIRPVLRRRDLVDLFDTTPDLCGEDLDISRYIRDHDDSDVQFFWRNVGNDGPAADTKPPRREELCRVSIGEAQKFSGKESTRTWQWNSLEEEWKGLKRLRPGGVYLVDAGSGGYDDDLGWTGEPKNKPTPFPAADGDADAQGKDRLTFARYWLPLDKHTQNVAASVATVTEALMFDPAMSEVFRNAAKWHDAGKAHYEFQKALRVGPHPPSDAEVIYAKSKNPYTPKAMAQERRGFRHELASALAWLSAGPTDAPERDLIAYLIAAHHGKVRLSIRALPDEKGDETHPDHLFARGVWDQDELPAIPGLTTHPLTLDMGLMQMGEGEHGSSWLARTISLRDRLGPFHLAFLEAVLRAADSRASAAEALSGAPCPSASSHVMELRESQPPAPAAAPSLSPAEQALVAALVADGLAIQDKFRPEPLYKQTGKGHYAGNTVEEIRKAKGSKAKGDKS
jgi:CRISPR-associated endonuclease/helicase Cas3